MASGFGKKMNLTIVMRDVLQIAGMSLLLKSNTSILFK